MQMNSLYHASNFASMNQEWELLQKTTSPINVLCTNKMSVGFTHVLNLGKGFFPPELMQGYQVGSDNFPLPAHGFGFNFDIIETNIINLAVVFGVVIYLGGDVLTSLLKDRKEKILGTLTSANDRFIEAEQRLVEAKQKVEAARAKALEIRQQGMATANQTTKNLQDRTKEEIQRLEEGKQATLRFEEEKAMSIVRQQVVIQSIEKAFSLLRTKIDASTQRRLIDTSINSLGKL